MVVVVFSVTVESVAFVVAEDIDNSVDVADEIVVKMQ